MPHGLMEEWRDEALRAAEDLSQINAYYQDIEIILGAESISNEVKVAEIAKLNGLIGKIAGAWV